MLTTYQQSASFIARGFQRPVIITETDTELWKTEKLSVT